MGELRKKPEIAPVAATLFCVIVSLAILLTVYTPNEGVWHLYADEMRKGVRIYSDLDLNQQPIFPLIVYANSFFADGLLGDRIPFIPIVILFAFLLLANVNEAPLSPVTKAVVLLAVFASIVSFPAFNFNDYHGITACLVLGSFLASVRYRKDRLSERAFCLMQGAISTLAFLTRPTDGVAIAAAAAVVLFTKARFDRRLIASCLASVVLAGAITGLAILSVNETWSAWFDSTIVQAPSAKGGEALYWYPLYLLYYLAEFYSRTPVEMAALGIVAGIAALAALKLDKNPDSQLPGILAALCGTSALASFGFGTVIWKGTAIALIASVSLLISLLFTRRDTGWVMIAYPFFYFVLCSLSSAGVFVSWPLGLALFILVVVQLELGRWRHLFLMSCLLIAATGIMRTYSEPFGWLDYRAPRMMLDNEWHRSAYISAELVELNEPVCDIVAGEELLSIPYPNANYFCDIPPWRGYVQTWFDTTTDRRVAELQADLADPPRYIWYQRQLKTLALFENTYRAGAPLPQRNLDRFIMGKIDAGDWKVVYESEAFSPSHWYLIDTHSSKLTRSSTK